MNALNAMQNQENKSKNLNMEQPKMYRILCNYYVIGIIM